MYGQFNLEGESKERGTLKGRNQEKEKANVKTLNLPQWVPGNLIMLRTSEKHKDKGGPTGRSEFITPSPHR